MKWGDRLIKISKYWLLWILYKSYMRVHCVIFLILWMFEKFYDKSLKEYLSVQGTKPSQVITVKNDVLIFKEFVA